MVLVISERIPQCVGKVELEGVIIAVNTGDMYAKGKFTCRRPECQSDVPRKYAVRMYEHPATPEGLAKVGQDALEEKLPYARNRYCQICTLGAKCN